MPALLVIHDDEDYWLVGDGVNDPNVSGACGLIHIRYVANLDPTIEQTATLPLGHCAYRDAGDQPWTFAAWSYADEPGADVTAHPDAPA